MLKPMTLSQLTTALSARLVSADASFSGVSIDSRSVAAGQLFVALTGPRFDGHDYLADVQAKGCLLYTSPSPRDQRGSRMPSSA